MVQPPPVAAQYNVLMERMEADFFRAGLHRYMYLDPVVCCPLSHQEILGKKNETITTTLIYLLLLSFASFILCVRFLRKTSPLEVCERASHDFDHIIKKSACLNGFFLTTKYTGKSEESTSLFERAASSKIEQNSLLLVCSMFSETVFTNIQHTGWT